MKKKVMQIITAILIITVTAGCGGKHISDPLSDSEEPPLPVEPLKRIVGGAPEKAPELVVSILQDSSPLQQFHAIQLTNNWYVIDEDGNGFAYGIDCAHAMQLDEETYAMATFFLAGASGIINIRFTDDFPPQSISVIRWNADYVTGSQDIGHILDIGESVIINGDTFSISNDGITYIYEVYATWPDNGSSWYAFRVETNNGKVDFLIHEYMERLGLNMQNFKFLSGIESNMVMYDVSELHTSQTDLPYELGIKIVFYPEENETITDDQIATFRTYIKAEFPDIKEENISIFK